MGFDAPFGDENELVDCTTARYGRARMTQANDWPVLPHGALEHLSPNILRVEGKLESGPPIKRVMTVARMEGGELVVHSAMALEESAMKELDAVGPVRFILVPNRWHRLDAPRYAKRYPDAKVLCPAGSRKGVEQVCRVDGTYADFPSDGRVRLDALDGVGHVEGVMIVEEESGVTLVMNDALFNMPHRTGVSGFILRHITQSSGGPRVSRLIRLFLLKDKAAFRANLERLAELPRLRRIVVAHHETIEDDPAGVLRQVAATL